MVVVTASQCGVTKMKKVCFITTISATLKSFVLKTVEYIHENTDWDISLVCTEDGEFASSLPEYIHYYPIHMERGISLSGVKAMLKMQKLFIQEKFDLIQYSTPNASFYASMAGFFARVPVRLYCQWGMAYVGFYGVKRAIFKAIEKLTCRFSTSIEPDSPSNLKFAYSEKLYPESKGAVIWNGSACGINLDKFDISKRDIFRKDTREKLSVNNKSFVFGFVGRITRDKGINELFQAFRKLYTGGEYLILVGPSEVDQTIDPKLYEWILNNQNVIFTGYTDKVEQYLAAMDCYILPSYREGFGMGVIEAEAMGVPVIVTNIPGPIDAMIDKKTGLVVEKKDVNGLVQAMSELLRNPDLCKQYGNAGAEYAKRNFEQRVLFEKILVDRKKLLKR
jgi:glycosyltransferase involved in cell wall biosynthesis